MMKSDWDVVEVREACELIVDCINNTAPTVDGPTPYKMLRTTNIGEGRIDLSDVDYVTEETYEEWIRRAEVNKGDVLLTREAPLGDVGLVREDDTVFLGQRVMQYRPDPEVLDSRYLTYAFLSPFVQNQIHKYKGSGSTVDHIRVPECEKIKIPLPPLEYQKKIADVLTDFDDKIQTNIEMNDRLEAIADALFQSWFIDFDNYTDFKDSKEGQIPSEFQVKELGELVNPSRGLSYTSDYLDKKGEEGYPMINLKNVEEGGGFREDGMKFYTKEEMKERYEMEPYDLIIAITEQTMDGSLLGSPALIPPIFDEDRIIISQDVCDISPKEDNMLDEYFLYYLMRSDKFRNYCHAHATGSTVHHLRQDVIKSYPVILPPESEIERFSDIVQSMKELQFSNMIENRYLEEMKQTLLPRLMTGEVRASDINIGEKKLSNEV
ncbi:hypothetical protein DP106_00870 [Halonotius pteroides]|uniref:Type I restriction modification DNA specificity domain-containing protein n=2 Tax=Halonotius pteroides TaxID=268735 RepID=A0A3A6Q9E9_9EURY|nr:hypothetical protein DP106_00870 [Halonotius pteroides]